MIYLLKSPKEILLLELVKDLHLLEILILHHLQNIILLHILNGTSEIVNLVLNQIDKYFSQYKVM